MKVKVKLSFSYGYLGYFLKVKIKFPGNLFYEHYNYSYINKNTNDYSKPELKNLLKQWDDIINFISDEQKIKEWVRLKVKEDLEANNKSNQDEYFIKTVKNKIKSINKKQLEFTFTKEELERE